MSSNHQPLIIGVDGGATAVKAHEVRRAGLASAGAFELGPAAAACNYAGDAAFDPVPLSEQLAQRDAGNLRPTPQETKQGSAWIAAACDAVSAVVEKCGGGDGRGLLIGMGMPGLKTDDRRGICVINNGPRIPDFLDRFEAELTSRDLKLVCPVAELGSDADYCGLGEEYATGGLFRDVKNAYYLGGGTGLADAMKLAGKLVPFDGAKDWILKSWQMHPKDRDDSFERLISAKAINDRYAAAHEESDDHADKQPSPWPEEAAAAGRPLAIRCMQTAAHMLTDLVLARMETLLLGRHAHCGTVLDRIVIGQRLGSIYGNPRYESFFAKTMEDRLVTRLAAHERPAIADAYLENGALRQGLIRASSLRAAPALGAAIAAARAHATASA